MLRTDLPHYTLVVLWPQPWPEIRISLEILARLGRRLADFVTMIETTPQGIEFTIPVPDGGLFTQDDINNTIVQELTALFSGERR